MSQMEQFSETIEHLSTHMLLNQLEKVMNVYLSPSSPMSVTNYLDSATLSDILRAYAAMLTLITTPQSSPTAKDEPTILFNASDQLPSDTAEIQSAGESKIEEDEDAQAARSTEVVIQRMILLAALERSRQELQDRLVLTCLPGYLDYVTSDKFKAWAKSVALQACNPQTATTTLTGTAAAVAAPTNSNSQLRFECILEDPLAYVSFFLFLHNDGIAKQLAFWYELEHANALAISIFSKALTILGELTTKPVEQSTNATSQESSQPEVPAQANANIITVTPAQIKSQQSSAKPTSHAVVSVDVQALENAGLLDQLHGLMTCLGTAAVIRTSTALPPVDVDALCQPPSALSFHPTPSTDQADRSAESTTNTVDGLVNTLRERKTRSLVHATYSELVAVAKVIQMIVHLAQEYRNLYMKHVSFDFPEPLNRLIEDYHAKLAASGEGSSASFHEETPDGDASHAPPPSAPSAGDLSSPVIDDDARGGRLPTVRISRVEEACAKLASVIADELTIISDVVNNMVPVCRVLRHLHIKLERQLRWQVWPSFWASPIYFEYCRLAKPNEKVGIPLYVQIERVLQVDVGSGVHGDDVGGLHGRNSSSTDLRGSGSGTFTSAAAILAEATVTSTSSKVTHLALPEAALSRSTNRSGSFSRPDSDRLDSPDASDLASPFSVQSPSGHGLAQPINTASFDSGLLLTSPSELGSPISPTGSSGADGAAPTTDQSAARAQASPQGRAQQAVTKASLKNLLFGRSFLSYLKKSPSMNNCVIVECRGHESHEKSRLRVLGLEHVPKHILRARAGVLNGGVVEKLRLSGAGTTIPKALEAKLDDLNSPRSSAGSNLLTLFADVETKHHEDSATGTSAQRTEPTSLPWSRPLLDHVLVVRGVPTTVSNEILKRSGKDVPKKPTRYHLEKLMQFPSKVVLEAEATAHSAYTQKKRRLQKLRAQQTENSQALQPEDALEESYLATWSRIELPAGIEELAFPHNAVEEGSLDAGRLYSMSPSTIGGQLGPHRHQAQPNSLMPFDAAATEWFSAVSVQAASGSYQSVKNQSILAAEWESSIPIFEPLSQHGSSEHDRRSEPEPATVLSRSESTPIGMNAKHFTATNSSISTPSTSSVAASPYTSLTSASAKALGNALKQAAAEASRVAVPPYLPERVFPFVLKEADGSRIYCAALHILGEEIYEKSSAQANQPGEPLLDSLPSILHGSDFVLRPLQPAAGDSSSEESQSEFTQRHRAIRSRPDQRIAYAIILVTSMPLVQSLLEGLNVLANEVAKFSRKISLPHGGQIDPIDGMLVRLKECHAFKLLCALTNPLPFTPNLYGVNRPPPPQYLPLAPPRLYVPPLDVYNPRAFTAMHPSRLVMILEMLLAERKVLILSKDIGLLSYIIEILIALLYPFSWPYPVISVLPLSMVSMLQCPTPFLFGVWTGHRTAALHQTQPNCFVVDVDQDETFYTVLRSQPTATPSKPNGLPPAGHRQSDQNSNATRPPTSARMRTGSFSLSSPAGSPVELVPVPPSACPPRIPKAHRIRLLRALSRSFVVKPPSCDRPEAAVSKVTFLAPQVNPVAALRLESLILWTNILCGYRNFVYVLPALVDGIASVASPPMAIFDTEGFINFKSDGPEMTAFLKSLLKTMLFPNLLHARMCQSGLRPTKFLPAVTLMPYSEPLRRTGDPWKDVVQEWCAVSAVHTDDAFDRLETIACGQRDVIFDVVSPTLAQAYTIKGATPDIHFDSSAIGPGHSNAPAAGNIAMRDHVSELMDLLSAWNASDPHRDSWQSIVAQVEKDQLV